MSSLCDSAGIPGDGLPCARLRYSVPVFDNMMDGAPGGPGPVLGLHGQVGLPPSLGFWTSVAWQGPLTEEGYLRDSTVVQGHQH